ncbi:unnamed protein product [Aureobasidium vineae]|uniref:Uncharacterized protein n=1 Tax=Aureobasidium vineae TaxID=2773715 RepID=A0A9N8JUE9_9PEZI|nr:unnamed protein product [Aureobasidium vineae]
MSFLGLSSRSPLALNIGAASGVFQLALGLTGVFQPRVMLQEVWGFKPSTKPGEEQLLIESLMQLYGVRNIALGLMILAVRTLADSRTLGWVLMTDILVAIGDGFVQKRCTGGGEWKHWSFVPVGVGMGMLLLGYFD